MRYIDFKTRKRREPYGYGIVEYFSIYTYEYSEAFLSFFGSFSLLVTFLSVCFPWFGYTSDTVELGMRHYIPPHSYRLLGNDGSSFVVTMPTSQEELVHLTHVMQLDERVVLEDSVTDRSCFRGIDLDPQYGRSGVYVIRKEGHIVGEGTLLVTPYRYFHNRLYLKKVGEELLVCSLADLYNNEQVSYLIEIGGLCILPKYRQLGVASKLVTDIFIPTIHWLVEKTSEPVLVLCSAEGALLDSMFLRVHTAMQEGVSGYRKSIRISEKVDKYLGKVTSEALFTPYMAQKMQLKRVDDVFDDTLGPVFATIINCKN